MKHRGSRKSKVLVFGLTLLALGLLPRSAVAQALWSPVDGKAKPVALLAADLSMTAHFDIDESVNDDSNSKEEFRGGGGCHSRCHEDLNKDNHPRYRTALFQSLARLKSITEEFEEQFVWGGFTYAGAHYAQIVDRAFPDPGAMQGSFQRVFGANADAILSSQNVNQFLNVETTNRIRNWKRCGVQNPAKQGTEYCQDGHRNTRNFETAEKILPPEIPAHLRTLEPNTCLMPDAGGQCQADDEALLELSKTGLTGLTLPSFPAFSFGTINIQSAASCDHPDATVDEIFPTTFLAEQLSGAGWPHWENLPAGSMPTEEQVRLGICEPLEAAAKNLKAALDQCLVTPTNFLDMSFLSQPLSSWCDASQIRQQICSSGPLANSCLCRPAADRQGCYFAVGETPCGTKMSVRLGRPGRHQWAMCEISAENSTPDSLGYQMSRDPRQSDNRIQKEAGRENIAILYTDGYLGGVKSGYRTINSPDMENKDTPIVVGSLLRPQAQQTLDTGFWANQTMTPTSNLFVLNHLRDRDVEGARYRSYTPGSNRLQEVLRDPSIDRGMPLAPGMNASNSWGIPDENKSHLATNLDQLREALRRSLNRAMAGSHRGAQPGLDRQGELMVFHNFHVFGPKKVGMNSTHPGEDYVPHASRLSFYEAGDGKRAPELICETDWQDKASTQLAAAGTSWSSDASTKYNHPIYTNSGRGLVRSLGANVLDRDGDEAADNHPALTLGRMSGGNSSVPVVVGAPVEIPLGADAKAFAEHMLSARTRPQVAYVMSNGFIHAFYAGRYQKDARSFGYDLSTGDLCKELWRHRPSWVTAQEIIDANTKQARQLMDGPMAAAELRVGYAGTAADYKTLLVAAQGKMGRGMVALDITDPVRPRTFRTWSLPVGFRATSLPTIAEAVSGLDGKLRPMVFMTGGYRGPAALHMFDLASGEEASIALPAAAGEDYPTAPVCFDRDGRGGATHCYVVSRFGRVARVEIDPNDGSRSVTTDDALADALERRRSIEDCLVASEPSLAMEAPSLESVERCMMDEPTEGPVTVPVLGTPHVRFGAARDMSPTGLPDLSPSGKRFYVSPVVFFDERGQVNMVFGSGDVKEMQRPAAIQNFVYKLVEPTRGFRMDASRACAPAGSALESGVLPLPEGHMMISPASVAKGVVSFTAYRPPSTAMENGTAVLYSMNYASCADAVTSARRPEARDIGEGLPGTPILFGESNTIMAPTTLRSGDAVNMISDAKAIAGGRVRVRRLYWRPLTSDRAMVPMAARPRLPRPGLLPE